MYNSKSLIMKQGHKKFFSNKIFIKMATLIQCLPGLRSLRSLRLGQRLRRGDLTKHPPGRGHSEEAGANSTRALAKSRKVGTPSKRLKFRCAKLQPFPVPPI